MKFALVVVLLVAVTSASVEHYHDYSVFRVRASNETQLQLIQQLEEQDVDFWRDADKVNMNADVMIAPEGKKKLLKYFADNGLQYSVLIADVEQLVENERQQQKKADEKMLDARWPEWNQGDQLIAGFWMKYQRYDQHMAFVNELAQKNPSFVQTVTFGQSYQGRSLKAVRIGVNSSTQKQVIWIQGGIHAREWISPAAVTYFAQQLVNKYNSGDQVTRDLLSYYDFYIVPVLNVDGYEYTHTNSRLWRKTRQPSRSWIGCIGADPNRNYGYRWGGQGASSQPCAETFRGERAFSEPETKAEADYLLNNFRGRLSAFIAVHSYGQYWLYPWGYGREFASNNAELNRVARVAVAAWNQVSPSTRFTIGTAATVLYAAAGGADDFALGSAGAKYAYTVECPDKGRFGFELPASEIVPVGRAMTNAFIALAQAVKGR